MTGEFRPNAAQREAIEFEIDKPLKVIAGAGTGKTAVLTQRFAWIVEKRQIAPYRILALTFTKKAAAEMQNRITGELLRRGLIDRSEAPLLLWIGNFHSVCLRLLKQSALVAGLDPSFAVVDETEQRLILGRVVNDFLNKRLAVSTEPDSFDDLMIERVDEFAQNVLAVLNRLKADLITAENLNKAVGERLSEHYQIVERTLKQTIANDELPRGTRKKAEKRLESLPSGKAHERLLLNAIYEIYRAYEQKLEEQDLLDFNDLILHTYRLMQTDPSIKKRFDYILVDEFQDTDNGQYQLLRSLSDDFKNVTVVCDKKQSIYEWREARIENIDDFPGETIFLGENYRSFGEILDAANFFIGQSMATEKPLVPAREGGRGRAGAARVRLFPAADREAEAEYVACEIGRLLEAEHYGAGEIAILMRSVRASRPYEDALSARGIHYTTVGSCGFYDLSETKDLLALLRLISNPFDNLSMARILQSAVVGLNDATLYALCRPDNGSESSIYDVLKGSSELIDGLQARTRERLRTLVDVIDTLANARWSLTIGELISEALDRTDYLKYLASLEGPRGARFSNVSLFYKTATLFEERHPGAGLEEFLSFLGTTIAGDAGPAPAEPKPDTVQVMTVHQAKGLEFPVVFVVNLRPGAFPLKFRADSFGYDEKFGLFARKLPQGDRIVRYEGGYGVNIEEGLKERQYLEENRIMYVAMTRARDRLYLTASAAENGKAADFLRHIEEFSSGVGKHSSEVISSIPIAVPVCEPEGIAADSMSIEEIKQASTRGVQRIALAPPARAEPEASAAVSLSYSRLAMFRQCPMKYALRYIYNLPLSPHEESQEESHPHAGSFALGHLLHGVLLHYHRRRKVDASADAYQILDHLSQGCSQEMLRAGRAMLKKYLDMPLSRMETLYEEKEFHWRLACGSRLVMFEGKVDRIHRQDDSLKIVDYKTGARHAETHALQLGIYRMAFESILDERDVLTSNVYLSTGEEIECRFRANELSEIRDGIIEDAGNIADRNFSVDEEGRHKNRDCAGCGYGSFCPRRRKDVLA